MERLNKLSKVIDREFDIRYWQSVTSFQRWQATWELVLQSYKVKKNGRLSRLDRSIESFKRHK